MPTTQQRPPRQSYRERRIQQLQSQIRGLEGSSSILDRLRLRRLREQLSALTPNLTTERRLYFDEDSMWTTIPFAQEYPPNSEAVTIESTPNGTTLGWVDVNEYVRRLARERLENEERLFRQGSHEVTPSMGEAITIPYISDLLQNIDRTRPLVRRLNSRLYPMTNPDIPREGDVVVYNLVRVCYKHVTPVPKGKDYSYRVLVQTV